MNNIFLNSRTKALAVCVGFFSFIAFTGCKEKAISGSGLIPPIDNIHTFNEKEFAIGISTHSHDSLFTNDYLYMVSGLGQISNDPFFGATNASIYFQIVPPENNFKFPEGIVIDSAVLFLPYFVSSTGNSYTYGDTTTQTGMPLSLNVHRVTGAFKYDLEKLYYSFDSIAYAATPIGSGTVRIKDIKDTTALSNGDTVYNTLRLKMTNAFINELATASSNVYASADAFTEYFRGLYITPSAPSSFLAYFRLDGVHVANYSYAQVCFFYHKSDDTGKTTLKKNFKLSLQHSSFFNRITRSYSGSLATPYLNNANTDSIVMQGIPGIRSDITIDLDGKIPTSVVNKATLTLTALNVGNDDKFTPPTQLIVMGVNEDGSEYYIADRTNQSGGLKSDGMDFVGGRPSPVTINGNTHLQYEFNIPREVQKCVSEGKNKLTLRIYPSTSLPGAYRMIAGGNNTTDELKVKFNVIYTLN